MRILPTRSSPRLALLAGSVLSACAGMQSSSSSSGSAMPPLSQSQLLARGVSALEAGNPEDARGYFRHVLKYDPRNAKAHLALAATFETDARDGNTQKRDLAVVGYQQALQFDERNWLAAFRLGMLEIEDGRYASSVDHLSRAAILNRHEPAILGELARALYLEESFPAARAVIERALKSSPDDAALLHNAAMIAAAGGDSAQARMWSERFRTVSHDTSAAVDLTRRLEDWQLEHARASRAGSVTTAGATRQRAADTVRGGFIPATRSPFLTPGETEAKSTMLQPLPQLPAGATARMVQVDVTLIRTQEIETDTRGVNLLTGLKANFAAGDERTITRTDSGNGRTTQSVTSTVLRALKVPDVLYSLDIANTGYDRSDVLARPLLMALDGQPANYFVGEQLSIPVSSSLGVTPGTLVDRSIGTEIAVTPTFIDDNTVLLSVSASRSFVSANFIAGPNSPIRQTVQRVTTSVVADFDQTVILSGLSEHESRSIRSGVPVLKEIPGIQYFFATKAEQLFETSVLVFITPRRVGQTQPASRPEEGTVETVTLPLLRQYFPELDDRITILRQLARTLNHNTFRALLAREDVVASRRQTRDEFLRRIARQLRESLVF